MLNDFVLVVNHASQRFLVYARRSRLAVFAAFATMSVGCADVTSPKHEYIQPLEVVVRKHKGVLWVDHSQRILVVRRLDLTGAHLEDSDVATIANTPEIVMLQLRGAFITDENVSTLCKIKNIEALDMSYTNASDVSVDALRKLTKLRSLSIAGTHITLGGITKLKECSDLIEISVDERQLMGKEGADAIKATLSKLKKITKAPRTMHLEPLIQSSSDDKY